MVKNDFWLVFVLSLLIVGCVSLKLDSEQHLTLKNGNLNAFRQAQLEKHNQLRKKHHVGALKLDKKLNQYAQSYAEKLAKLGEMVHSDGEYGQNLYYTFSQPPRNYTNGAATLAWYDEIKLYDWQKAGFSSETGHFTQVIWKGSRKVGFGFGSNSKGEDFIVAEYFPPGNYQGQYKNNVLPI